MVGRHAGFSGRPEEPIVKTSYPDPAALSAVAVLDPQPLTATYDAAAFVVRLWTRFSRTRLCYAKNATLAEWFGCSVDTITRRVKAAIAAGFVRVEYLPGRGRLIYLLRRPRLAKDAPPAPGPCGGSAEALRRRCGDLTYKASDLRKDAKAKETTNTATPEPETKPAADPDPVVVLSLCERGMERNTAKRLVALYGEKRAQAALALLGAQKAVSDAAGWLYRAIERGYQASSSGNGHDAAHPSNRDTAANLAAAAKQRSAPVIVRQPAPPRADLAGLTPKQRLDALMGKGTVTP
jgi:hypothetical protein